MRIANSWQNQPPQNKTTTNPPWSLGVFSGSLFCLYSTSALNRIMFMISALSVTPFLPPGARWIVGDWQEGGGRVKFLPKASWSPSRLLPSPLHKPLLLLFTYLTPIPKVLHHQLLQSAFFTLSYLKSPLTLPRCPMPPKLIEAWEISYRLCGGTKATWMPVPCLP